MGGGRGGAGAPPQNTIGAYFLAPDVWFRCYVLDLLKNIVLLMGNIRKPLQKFLKFDSFWEFFLMVLGVFGSKKLPKINSQKSLLFGSWRNEKKKYGGTGNPHPSLDWNHRRDL